MVVYIHLFFLTSAISVAALSACSSPGSKLISVSTPDKTVDANRPASSHRSTGVLLEPLPPVLLKQFYPVVSPSRSVNEESVNVVQSPAGAAAVLFTPQNAELVWKMQQPSPNFMNHPAPAIVEPASKVTHADLDLVHERQVARYVYDSQFVITILYKYPHFHWDPNGFETVLIIKW